MSRQTDYPPPFMGRSSPHTSSSAAPGVAPGRQSPRGDPFFEDPEDPLAQMRTHFDRDRHSFFQDPDRYRGQHPGPQWSAEGHPGFFRNPRGFPDTSFGVGGGHDFPPHFVDMNFPDPEFSPRQQHYQRAASPREGRRGSGGSGGGQAAFEGETIPIRVVHERTRNHEGGPSDSRQQQKHHQHHPVGPRNTTELPARSNGPESPRLERAHSEPPKNSQQRMFHRAPNYSSIPEGGHSSSPLQQQQQEDHSFSDDHDGLQVPRNLSTSASAPSVPSSSPSSTPVPPPRKSSSPSKVKQDSLRKQPAASASAASAASAAAPQSVRHIPIFVEGRDDPVVARLGSSAHRESAFPKPSDYYPAGVKKTKDHQRPDGVSTVKEAAQLEPSSPIGPPPGPIPMGCSASHMNVPAVFGAAAAVEPTSPLPAPKGPIPLPCSPDYLQPENKKEEPARERSASPQVVKEMEELTTVEVPVNMADAEKAEDVHLPEASSNEPNEEPKQEPPRKVSREDVALDKMQLVKKEVEELIARIDNFKGSKKDKEYLYLDEMLTRHLLSLDGIETCGREDMRQMRKEAIRTITRCLSMLDTRAGGGKAAAAKSIADENNEVLAQLAEQSKK